MLTLRFFLQVSLQLVDECRSLIYDFHRGGRVVANEEISGASVFMHSDSVRTLSSPISPQHFFWDRVIEVRLTKSWSKYVLTDVFGVVHDFLDIWVAKQVDLGLGVSFQVSVTQQRWVYNL